jgi:hypothetical protein
MMIKKVEDQNLDIHTHLNSKGIINLYLLKILTYPNNYYNGGLFLVKKLTNEVSTSFLNLLKKLVKEISPPFI